MNRVSLDRRAPRCFLRMHRAPVRTIVIAVLERKFGIGQPVPGFGQTLRRVAGGTGLLRRGNCLTRVAHGLHRWACATAEHEYERENAGAEGGVEQRGARPAAHINAP